MAVLNKCPPTGGHSFSNTSIYDKNDFVNINGKTAISGGSLKISVTIYS